MSETLDPRIEDLFEEIKKIKKAISVLAMNIDGITWRVATDEERNADIEIYDKIMEILGE